ncbi:hypothetical protein AGMMS4956_18310 [Bacteroidia bacterium]|nr:hypothetical protein AGMMS4956_18310 [Bacteroidia bacterium]
MKNLIYITAIALACFACKKESEPTQDYTSFAIKINDGDQVTLPNVVSGYFDGNGYCWKIAEHGTLSMGQTTEETILTIDVDSIYIFSDYLGSSRFNNPLIIKKNKKNTFNVSENPLAIDVNNLDSLQYPQ